MISTFSHYAIFQKKTEIIFLKNMTGIYGNPRNRYPSPTSSTKTLEKDRHPRSLLLLLRRPPPRQNKHLSFVQTNAAARNISKGRIFPSNTGTPIPISSRFLPFLLPRCHLCFSPGSPVADIVEQGLMDFESESQKKELFDNVYGVMMVPKELEVEKEAGFELMGQVQHAKDAVRVSLVMLVMLVYL